MWKLYKLEPSSGINNKSLFGVKFVSGTSIILSKLAVQYILENIKEIKISIFDDVAIGILMSKITKPIELSIKLTFNKIDKNGVLFRNKLHSKDRSKDRNTDTERMKKIVNMIIERNNLSI